MLVFVLSTFVAVFVSFLCSMAEAVLLSVDKVKIETDKEKGLTYARIMHKLKSNIDRPISAILILNTIAHTGGATIAGSAFDALYGEKYIWIFSVIFTIVILFGTEILPKVIGVNKSNLISRKMAWPLQLLIKILHPFILVTQAFTKLLVGKRKKSSPYSLDDIRTIARMAKMEKIIDTDQENIIINTSTLKKRFVKEIMLPVEKIIFFKENISFDKYFNLASRHKHTRYPISRTDSIEEVYGYINFKEIALNEREDSENRLTEFIRPIIFINENTPIITLLKKMNENRFHISMVKSNDDKILGMITLENLVETIVGDIEDEFD
ncbi:Hemolysin, contains CBS domains [Marivirga sericea]|uniref:Hemolysin, contains CBS domains n=1 Tax=Marivirga sericea TaxID=1028 RepID=A0A1X7KNP2_9BACT|nr:CNNM domain-containing protein [Marivirga sericea]SMG42818.1 Hemolysin, contains CBS domains [Marivirga sericea]